MNKIQLLLSAANEPSIKMIKDSLELEWRRIKNEMPNLDNRIGVRVTGDPTARVSQDGQPDIMPEQPSFDLVLEARGKDVSFSDLGQVLSGVGSRLESLIDRASSAALVGTGTGLEASRDARSFTTHRCHRRRGWQMRSTSISEGSPPRRG